jgi:hypothetical protein
MARPRFVPTDEQRRLVRSLAALGTRQEEIVRFLKLRSAKTLRRHFRDELDLAATEANAQVAKSLYQQAISGKHTAAAIYWLDHRAGWQDPTRRSAAAPPFVVTPDKDDEDDE